MLRSASLVETGIGVRPVNRCFRLGIWVGRFGSVVRWISLGRGGFPTEAPPAHESANDLAVRVLVHQAERVFDFTQALGSDTPWFLRSQFPGNVGTPGPSPELFFGFFFGLGGLKIQPEPLDVETFGVKVASAQAIDVETELVQQGQPGLRIILPGKQSAGRGRDMKRGPLGDFVVEFLAQKLVAEGVLIIQALDDCEDVLTGGPVAVAAVLPFGEIAGDDGPALEVETQNGLDFGKSVDPGEDGFGGFAVLEAVVEVFADGMGKTS